MTVTRDINVFISYSHDSELHRERVLGLSERLRADGIATILDRYVLNRSPEEGWPRWMMNALRAATHVLCICTQAYYRRFIGQEVPYKGKGVDWEGALITQALYDARSLNNRFIPVLFAASDEQYVPDPLRAQTHYLLDSDTSYESLYDTLLAQSGIEPGPIGEQRLKQRVTAQPLKFLSESTIGADPAAPTLLSPPLLQTPLEVWQEKLSFLLIEEAINGDPAMKFRLTHLIAEATEQVRRLKGT